jgi:hypothetical protein
MRRNPEIVPYWRVRVHSPRFGNIPPFTAHSQSQWRAHSPIGAPLQQHVLWLLLCYGLQGSLVGQLGPGFPSAFRVVGIDSAPARSTAFNNRIRIFFTVELLCGGLAFNRGNVGWIGVFADANAGSSGFLKLERGK